MKKNCEKCQKEMIYGGPMVFASSTDVAKGLLSKDPGPCPECADGKSHGKKLNADGTVRTNWFCESCKEQTHINVPFDEWWAFSQEPEEEELPPKPHKHDRCPCGSTKKYGKCCMDKEVEDPSKARTLVLRYTPAGLLEGMGKCGECGSTLVCAGKDYVCLGHLEPEEMLAASIQPEFDEEGEVTGGARMPACCENEKHEKLFHLDLDGLRSEGFDPDLAIKAAKRFETFVKMLS